MQRTIFGQSDQFLRERFDKLGLFAGGGYGAMLEERSSQISPQGYTVSTCSI
jgi:hypothetical protein